MKTETFNKNETFGIVGTHDVMRMPPKPGERGTFLFRDLDHTPYNKRRGQVESWAELDVTSNPEGHNTDNSTNMSAPVMGWTAIKLTEYVKHEDRTVTKTISLNLSHDARKALLAYLLDNQ